MIIDKRLNFVVPVERDAGDIVYVHAAPISREVFERYFLVIAKTFSAIYGEGLGIVAGPKAAGLMLKKVAADMGADVARDVEQGLAAEIRRLSNVLMPAPTGGWATVPLQEALDRGYFSADDMADVDGVLTFFTVASAMHRKTDLKVTLDGAARLWDAQITSLNCTEFGASLPTSTAIDSSGAREIPSSIPV